MALPYAAHLARTLLVHGRVKQWDADSLDVIATALARVTRLYVSESNADKPRELLDGEIQGATAKRGASTLLLKDGRTLSSVWIKRGDLRQAIGILKVVGIPELGSPTGENATVKQTAGAKSDRMTQLQAQLAELEALMDFPLPQVPADLANNLATSVARGAPHGAIANLAMRLIDALHDARSGGDEQNVRVMLARLRLALDEAEVS